MPEDCQNVHNGSMRKRRNLTTNGGMVDGEFISGFWHVTLFSGNGLIVTQIVVHTRSATMRICRI